jgi:putative transposase
MVTPTAKRNAVGVARSEFRISERRACRTLGVERSILRYRSRRADDALLVARLQALALERNRWGYRLLGDRLRREGFVVNHKRVWRLYKAAGLSSPRRRRRKGLRARAERLPAATRPNERWAMDFVSDSLASGRRFRCLTIVDQASRECPGLLVDTSIGGNRVTRFLDGLAEERGLPSTIVTDNGPEFTGKKMFVWAERNAVKLHFIDPGKPSQNGHCESFNSTFRRECLDASWFSSLFDARPTIEGWRRIYNEDRPHSSIGRIPPAEFSTRPLAAEPMESAENASRLPPIPQAEGVGG